jgi:hypothetical protein
MFVPETENRGGSRAMWRKMFRSVQPPAVRTQDKPQITSNQMGQEVQNRT